MGNFYEGGPWVKADYIEAYKWYRVASKQNPVIEHMHLDRLVLKMTKEQIEQGERRAKQFVTHQTTQEELPPPQYLNQIVLKGIAGSNNRRLAIINGQTFEKGETGKIRIGQKFISLKCVDIQQTSVVIMVEGMNQPTEIRIK
jgi:TPR repeat protein